MVYALFSFISYCVGSLPFGLLLSKFFSLEDIRTIGSGNIGATNVLRTGNKCVAGLTLLLDILKGTIVVFFCSYFFPSYPLLVFLCAFFVFLGHLFPVWLGFKGGKGVATYLGILLFFSWKCALFFSLVWIISIAISRYSSLSSLISTTLTPVFLYFFDSSFMAIFFFVLTIFVWERHFLNIKRLYVGKELKILK